VKAQHDEVAELAKHLATEIFTPPRQMAQAVWTLAGGAAITEVVSTTTQPNHLSDITEVTWECMGIAGDAVIRVRGTRAGNNWHWNSDRAQTELPEPVIFGDLVPKTEIAGCRVLAVMSEDSEHWVTRWQVQLRSGESLPLPWSELDYDTQVQHENLALAIAKLLR
jgi:hypothetical protein